MHIIFSLSRRLQNCERVYMQMPQAIPSFLRILFILRETSLFCRQLASPVRPTQTTFRSIRYCAATFRHLGPNTFKASPAITSVAAANFQAGSDSPNNKAELNIPTTGTSKANGVTVVAG